jgi:hypothetical protein
MSLGTSVLTLVVLTSCTPSQLAWFKITNGTLAAFAVCSEYSRVDAIRISTSDNESWQSFGGPGILVGSVTELNFQHLPDGWQSLGSLSIGDAQDEPTLYVDAYNNGELAFSRGVRVTLDDVRQGWFSNGGWEHCGHERGTEAPDASTFNPGFTGPNAALAVLDTKPMSRDKFWSILATHEDHSRLSHGEVGARLGKLSLGELKEFHARLLLELFDLDTFATWSAVQSKWAGNPDTDPEDFLTARLDLLLAGRSTVEQAKAGIISDNVTVQSGEKWLYQSAQIVAEARGDEWAPVDYRLPPGVGLNHAGWTATAP